MCSVFPAGTSSTDTVCSTCSDGTFSDGTFTSCQNHKQCESEGLLLRAGTETEDAQCGGEVSDRNALIICGVAFSLAIVCYLVWNMIQQKKSRKRRHSGPSYLEGVNSGQSSQQNLKSNDSKHSKIEVGQI
nr:tumor necrosis factor receptor superfamily member 11B-like [Labrus bergylta]